MSFTIIHCLTCGGNPVGKGSTPITIEAIEPDEPCEKCHNRENRRKANYHFCGTQCMMEYLLKNNGLKCQSYQCRGGKDTLNKGRDCIFCRGTGMVAAGKWDPSEGSLP